MECGGLNMLGPGSGTTMITLTKTTSPFIYLLIWLLVCLFVFKPPNPISAAHMGMDVELFNGARRTKMNLHTSPPPLAAVNSLS